jgi:hypothetical protein
MRSVLYILWFALPTIFFLMALWTKLERMGGEGKKGNASDLFSQGVFLLCCVLLAVLIDQTVLEDLVSEFVSDSLPLGFFQFFLFPFILLIGAKIVGPSKKILIPSSSNRTPRSPKRRK